MKVKLNTGRDAVALAFADAYTNAENTGGKIADVCKLAQAAYKGETIPDDDVSYIVDRVATAKKWDGASLKVRCSEARKVLSVYNVLPEGIQHVRETKGSCDWRAALRLATCLKKSEGNLKAALAAFELEREGSSSTPEGRAAGALKSWYKTAKPAKRAKILEAAQLLGLKLSVN